MSKKVERYESKVVKGQIVWYAICGKEKIEMPSGFSEMYDDDHLAIQEVSYEMAEVLGFDKDQVKVWIPLRTAQ